MLALARRGVEARKAPDRDERFAVVVPRALRDEALLALEGAGLPRPTRTQTADLLENPPLVPSPAWERTQRTVGLEGDMMAALAGWPGVVEAEVLLGLPPDGSGAAVLVVYDPGSKPDPEALSRFVRAKLPAGLAARIELLARPELAPLPDSPARRSTGHAFGAAAGGGGAALAAALAALGLRWRRRRAS